MKKTTKADLESEVATLRREVADLTTKLGHAEAEARSYRRSRERANTEITRLANRQEALLMALSLARTQAMDLERQIEILQNGDPQAFDARFIWKAPSKLPTGTMKVTEIERSKP